MADDNTVEVPVSVRTADLPVRLVSAAVLLVIACVALAVGGRVLDGFITLVALVGFAEMVRLIFRATGNWLLRIVGMIAGAVYFGLAATVMTGAGTFLLILVLGVTIFTDTGAYFAGRAIGGPKIAPSISPSKTWAGLAGGIIAAVLWVFLWVLAIDEPPRWLPPRFEIGLNLSTQNVTGAIALGAGLAIVAQCGDFFESWLKRKAGVKDSSRLIPGHGGVFDRIDGLVPVAIVAGLIAAWMAP
ncbi:MAG TPA: phosphatidate cytidylyltransferase [Croceibacterium sp.]|nr:phosphatidate cytidylyltransferase [Croceibacterium sp.]